MKKIIIFLSVMLCTSALAANAEVVSDDFNGYAPSNSLAAPDGYETDFENSSSILFGGAAEKFGKDDNDICLKINPIRSMSSAIDRSEYTLMKNVSLSGEGYIHFSAELAAAYPSCNVSFIQCFDGGEKEVEAFELLSSSGFDNRDWAVSFFGGGKNIPLPEYSWLRVDAVINSESGAADFYLNGKLAAEGVYIGFGNIESFDGFKIKLSRVPGNNAMSWPETELYIDNVICGFGEYPKIDEFVPYAAEKANDINVYLNLTNDKYTSLDIEKGVFGKTAEDGAIRAKTGGFYVPGADSPAMWQQIRWENPAAYYPDNKSRYILVSGEIAATGSGMDRWVGLIYNFGHESSQSSVAEQRIFTIEGGEDGLLVCGSGIENSYLVPENRWVKYDILIETSASSSAQYDLYIDGKKVTESPVSLTVPSDSRSWYSLSKIKTVILGINHKWVADENGFPECVTYFDNLSVQFYGDKPKITDRERNYQKELSGVFSEQDTGDGLYKAEYIMTASDLGTFKTIKLKHGGLPLGAYKTEYISGARSLGGKMQVGLMIYDIPPEYKDFTLFLDTADDIYRRTD